MMKEISKLLTGDMLKALCDMGHGDTLVIADTNYPTETVAKRLIRCPGLFGVDVLEALAPLFPLDTYVDELAQVMDRSNGQQQGSWNASSGYLGRISVNAAKASWRISCLGPGGTLCIL